MIQFTTQTKRCRARNHGLYTVFTSKLEIKAILENKQEKKDSQSLHPVVPAEKAFLRGADYYKDGNLK